jgi:hypothetical protein
MSQERLREHFSDLYEGTIDPGLAQQINARFKTDFALKDDYDHFVTTMFMLGKMPEEQIEIPSHLSSMIADRLAANPKKTSMSLGAFWRNLGFGTLACVAIGSAFFAVKNSNSSNGPREASIADSFPIAPSRVLDTIKIRMVKGEPTLMYDSSGPKTVTVVNVEDQKLVKKYEVDSGRDLKSVLANTNEQSAAFQIEATGENTKHLVIIPGSSTELEAVGKGDLVTFAKLLATKYRKVVHLQFTVDSKTDLQWDITAGDAQVAATTVLSATDYTVTTGADGILNIQATN